MSNMEYAKPVEILLVEDNPYDVRLMKETLIESKISNNLNVVNDGVEAIAYLKKEDKYIGTPHPDLILLDLNLPKLSGHDVLDFVKNDSKLKTIPVVMVTSSRSEEDIVKSYELHANCYVTKPVNLEQFTKVVNTIQDFWFTIVKLPGR
ncbi:response regulator [Chloroflexota bacterium]